MPQDIGIISSIVLLYLPETLIERKLVASFSLHLLEDDLFAFGGKDAATA
jgi:hypothetical protein